MIQYSLAFISTVLTTVILSHFQIKIQQLRTLITVVLDGIRKNIYSLVQSGKYGAINKTYTTIMGYCMAK